MFTRGHLRQLLPAISTVAALGFVSIAHPDSRARLATGPMVGYSAMREVGLWVQTEGPAAVRFRYWPENRPDEASYTQVARTRRADAFTAKVAAGPLTPGTRYRYELLLDGEPAAVPWDLRFRTQELWQWRRDPPELRAAVGSCLYVNQPELDRPGEPYGGGFEILEAIRRRSPDLMLWLGDNVYLRETDWDSRSGMLARYTHDRRLPELQPLLGSVHHYAIWDDHDAGPNNTHRSQWNLSVAQEAFRLFWPNPGFGVPGVSGLTTKFTWADIDFFLLDNRSHRTPNERTLGEATLLGESQIEWLIDNLAASQAPFKLVALGGQFLSTAPVHENYVNLAPGERDRLLRAIQLQRITGVIFLTGDRHHTEVSKLESWGYPPIYDLTFSPLTAGPHSDGAREPNSLRVPGTVVTRRNFGWLHVSGPRGERVLTVSSHDTAGEQQWALTITQKELEEPLPRRVRGASGIPSADPPR